MIVDPDQLIIIIIAIQYAFSFFIFGWIVRGWKERDKREGRENWWVVKYYWNKLTNNEKPT